jgi:predicted lipid-binding transport protein (Tim44 family)
MTRSAAIGLVVVACLICPTTSHARGGGGCFLPDTPILRADGSSTPICEIQPGDRVLVFNERGDIVTSTVRRVISLEVDEYFVVVSGQRELRVTGEHPFYDGDGKFRTVESLRVGDLIFALIEKKLVAEPIISIRRVPGRVTVFNLQTEAPFTYFADGVAVHNKGGGGGGCFLAGTPIHYADGTSKPIQEAKIGDRILAFTADGQVIDSLIRQVTAREVDEYFVLQTPIGQLRVTGEHPFLARPGDFREVKALRVGDSLYALNGSTLRPVPILAIHQVSSRVVVYNLTTDEPRTYFAGEIAVHNKGGGGGFGGGHSYDGSGGSSGGDPTGALIFVVIVAGVVVFQIIKNARKQGDLDYSYASGPVRHKADKTGCLLDFLARQDPTMKKEDLAELVKSVFLQMQECWQARDYAPMKPLLMPDLFAEHESQLQSMRRSHEIDRIENVSVESVDIVSIRYTDKPEQREFTALVTATARDYYVDDRTNEFLRGDRAPAQFQEFWTFHRSNDAWLLREIEQTKESDALTRDNFVEMFTDAQLQQIYQKDAGAAGVVGPEMTKEVKVKGDKIQRMLNFLEQTSPAWKRPDMLHRVREIFFHVHQVQEQGDPQAVSESYLFPDVAANLRQVIEQRRDKGVTLEFRNLCLRKIDILLVRNRPGIEGDEFTVRISAHAQKTVSRAGAVVSRDADVTPFEECWTLGRRDGTWKLKEVLPMSEKENRIRQENLDEDTSPEMVQWYYTKSRAL